MLQAALMPEQTIELVMLNTQEERDAFYESNPGLAPVVPVLEQPPGELHISGAAPQMQESEAIISYLQSLPGARLPQPPRYNESQLKTIRDLLVEIRFALQYYYKLHYEQSILHKAEIAPFPGSAPDDVQKLVNTLNDLLYERFDEPESLRVTGISSDDFVIFAELPLIYELNSYAKFTLGDRIDAYMRELLSLCSHLRGFEHRPSR